LLLGNTVTQNTECATIQATKTDKQIEHGTVITNVLSRLIKGNTRTTRCQETGSSAHVAALTTSLFEFGHLSSSSSS
jgi:hypothetical protein